MIASCERTGGEVDTIKRSIIKTTTGEQMYLHGFYIREKPGHLHRPGLVVRPEEGVQATDWQ